MWMMMVVQRFLVGWKSGGYVEKNQQNWSHLGWNEGGEIHIESGLRWWISHLQLAIADLEEALLIKSTSGSQSSIIPLASLSLLHRASPVDDSKMHAKESGIVGFEHWIPYKTSLRAFPSRRLARIISKSKKGLSISSDTNQMINRPPTSSWTHDL